MKTVLSSGDRSEAAKCRLLACRGEPLFYASWERTVFIHYEADLSELQKCVPFDVDLYEGRAFVSVVAFTMRRMRPRLGRRVGALFLKPIATHRFLNLRTYVQHEGEAGIYFIAEWLSNRISACLGPWTFGLPYRFGQIIFEDNQESGELRRDVAAKEGRLSYRAALTRNRFELCQPESLAEFLLERYSAFTEHGRRRRFFRVWHEPWRQTSIDINIVANDLIDSTGNWSRRAHCIGGNYSPGVDVWMGWPHRIDR